jgi:hypothetical protein
MFERKPQYAGRKLFQALPKNISTLSDFNKFKNSLKNFLNHPPNLT